LDLYADSTVGLENMAAATIEYDLTGVISKFLDRHLVFPILEFLSQKQLYDGSDIEAAKLELGQKTNMVDFAVDVYQQLHGTTEVRSRPFPRGHYYKPED
jgi:hypothetical protein